MDLIAVLQSRLEELYKQGENAQNQLARYKEEVKRWESIVANLEGRVDEIEQIIDKQRSVPTQQTVSQYSTLAGPLMQ
jgi:methyl-accepting chemotaxis protein